MSKNNIFSFFGTDSSNFMNFNAGKLTPDYIVGLIDGDGHFSIRVIPQKNNEILVEPSFWISGHVDTMYVLFGIQDFLQGGVTLPLPEKKGPRSHRGGLVKAYKYQIEGLLELERTIIPFLKENPLKTSKRNIFEMFCEICEILKANNNTCVPFEPHGEQILKLVSSMSWDNGSGYTIQEILSNPKGFVTE